MFNYSYTSYLLYITALLVRLQITKNVTAISLLMKFNSTMPLQALLHAKYGGQFTQLLLKAYEGIIFNLYSYCNKY